MLSDFACGWIGGAAGVAVSHPLDTLRVLVQTDARTSLARAAWKVWHHEGHAGFFKGLASPILAVGAWKACLFACSARVATMLRGGRDERPPVWHAFVGGVAGGMVGLVVQMPFERIKVVAQTSPPPPSTNGLLHEVNIMAQIWRTEGIRGLYRGTLLNMILGPMSIGVWFGTNEWMLRSVRDARGEVSLRDEFLCGSLAGTLAWAVNFPSDKAKAIVQAAAARLPRATDWEILQPHVRAEGVAFLFRGVGATLLRAIPQTGATIATYSFARRSVGGASEPSAAGNRAF